MIKDFKPRLYQETIMATAAKHNTLVVLPTGLGKTNIFLMLAAHRLTLYPNSKILLIGPTRPLIDQYYNVFRQHFEVDEKDMATFTGMVSPEKREELWKTSKIIFSTPQGLENDVISEKIKLEEVSLLGIDEAHRATGDYAYNFIAKQYVEKAKYPRILALTASPGSDIEKIQEVCKNLYIEEIEVRTEQDSDVSPYVQDTDIEWIKVELPASFKSIQKHLQASFKSKLEEAKKYGIIRSSNIMSMGKKELLSLQGGLHAEIAQGNKDFGILKSVSLLAESLKVYHALELLETQGITALNFYMEKIRSESATTKVKAVQNLVRDPEFKAAMFHTGEMNSAGVEHPKMKKVKDIIEQEVAKDPKIKVIVFTQYRDSASKIVETISAIANVKAEIFMGQANKREKGLTQKKQIEALDRFKAEEFNVLVATSVAEEGLDIPAVDLVIFYEPIPSAIRTIQRKGRTGRQEAGRVIVLMAENTRDEGYRWSAHHKEKRMHRTLKTLKSKLRLEKTDQPTLKKFESDDQKPTIFVDYREKGSGVMKELIELGVRLRLESLNTADYILSQRVGVEYKTVRDFVDSIVDGRLLEQIKSLRNSFEVALVVVEGIEDIYSIRNVHPNAIRGMLATIAVSYNIPVILTKNSKETASILSIIAQREQESGFKAFSMHGSRKPLSLKEQQEYIVSSLPSVGPLLAKDLLKKFGSVKGVINADVDALKEVEGVGEKISKRVKEAVDNEYGTIN